MDSYQLEATRKRYQARTADRQRKIYKIGRGEFLSVDTPDRVSKFLQRRGIPAEDANRLIAEDFKPSVMITESVGVREPNAFERVLGTSDLMGIAFLERGLTVSQTVARIWVDARGGSPTGYGTGFMISPQLMMTNNHVLGDAATARASKAEFNYQLGADGVICPPFLYGLSPDVFFITNRDLDYTVVAVAGAADSGRPLAEFGFNPLFQEEGKAIEAQWVNIVQHPSGGYKQLALRENQLIDIFDSFLTYRTDTAPGSSGSPIFNDRWEVVGIHHSGVMAKDPNGNVLAVDGSIWTPDMGEARVKWVANEGIRISRIVADLRAQATSTAHKRMVDDMLSHATTVLLRAEARSAPKQTTDMGLGPKLASDGSATWTVPITITVQLPGMTAPSEPATGAAPPQAQIPAPNVESPAPTAVLDTAADVLGEARSALGARSDVLSVRAGYVFENGWITKKPAIVVKVRRKLAPAKLHEAGIAPLPKTFRGLPVEVVNPSIDDLMAMHPQAAAIESLRSELVEAEEILYLPPAGADLRPVTARMKVTASVSPDHGWPVLESFLAGVRQRLVVGMYDFGALHIVEAIEAAARPSRFRQMSLAIQGGSDAGKGTKAADLSDDEIVERLRQSLGAKFDSAWVKIGIKNGWVASSYHIKVAVRDRDDLWLSSGNWQSSNQPKADPLHEVPQKRSWLTKYNREWHIVIENQPDLARLFETYLLNDLEENKRLAGQEAMDMPDVLLPGAIFLESPEEAAAAFEYFDKFSETREFTVQPLLTPDNYGGHLLRLVREAESQLLIENQTFNAAKDNQPELGELLDAIIDRQNAGVDVRIIFRLLDATKARENLEALQNRGFDMTRVKVQRNCHTKGIVADGKRVLVGSQNLSQLGITLNRDASLLFDDEGLAAYFTRIFEHDWRNLARQNIGSESLAPELAPAGDTAPPGTERLSWKEYMELA